MSKTKDATLPLAFSLQSVAPGEMALTNSGKLTVFFIGVGSAFSKRHFQNNLLIVKGNDHLLVDCGTRTPQALYELGLPVAKVSNFYLTHSHADHVGGLEEVMLVSRYGTGKKPHVWITETFQSLLWDMSLRGGSAFNEENGGNNLAFGDFWTIHRPEWAPRAPRETWKFDVGGIQIQAFRTMHIPSNAPDWQRSFWSTGLLIDERVLFTGDTRFDPALLDEICSTYPIETIFHDCQFLPAGGVHAAFEELRTLPSHLKAKTVLMHYGDNWETFEPQVKEAGFIGLASQWTNYVFPDAKKRGRA